MAAAGAEGVAAGAAPLFSSAASTSRRTTRPPSPEPCTAEMSIPDSFAMLFANGDAFTRPSPPVGAGAVATGAPVEAAAAAGAGAGAGSGDLTCPLDAVFSPAPTCDCQSSPGFPMTAIRPSTGTTPSLTAIWSKVPSQRLSKSIVALSVSISASRSPGVTLSPSFLCHATIFPSSIVSLMRGILIISAILFY